MNIQFKEYTVEYDFLCCVYCTGGRFAVVGKRK